MVSNHCQTEILSHDTKDCNAQLYFITRAVDAVSCRKMVCNCWAEQMSPRCTSLSFMSEETAPAALLAAFVLGFVLPDSTWTAANFAASPAPNHAAKLQWN